MAWDSRGLFVQPWLQNHLGDISGLPLLQGRLPGIASEGPAPYFSAILETCSFKFN